MEQTPFFCFSVGADCIPRSESASTIASLKACDAKGAKGVFWRFYGMSLFYDRADFWLVTCSEASYTAEIATIFSCPKCAVFASSSMGKYSGNTKAGRSGELRHRASGL